MHSRFLLSWGLGLAASLSVTTAAQAAPSLPPLPDFDVPPAAEPYKEALWNYQGLLMLGLGIPGLWWFFKDDDGKKGQLASAAWGGKKEKAAARKVALQQINERKRNGLTTWINAPQIKPLKTPKTTKKTVKRFAIKPKPSTLFIPDGQRGTAVAGAPGSGKTFSVIDPMIRSVVEQGFPICLYDFKFPGGQAEAHVEYARQHGYQIHVFAPGFAGSEVVNLLDFLNNADDSETAGQIAKVLNKNFSLNGGRGGDDPFFQMSGDQLIKAVLQLAKATDHPDFLTCQKILALDASELIDRVSAADISPWIRTSWDQFTSMRQSEKTSSSVAATASLMFTNFVSPDILPSLIGKSTLPLDLSGKQMVVFGMDQNRRDIIGPILATVMHMLITRNVATPRTDPLAVFLDELPTLSLPSLVNWLNESRSAGFCGVLGYQNMTQLEKAYGKELSRAILSGCNTKFIFNPGEYESAQYFSQYLGETEIHIKQKSKSTGKSGASRSISEQDRTRKLMTPDEILRLPVGHCIFLNPAYRNKTEANIPLKLPVKILPGELKKEAESRAGFERLHQALIKRAEARGVVTITSQDIHIREASVDRLLPLLDDDGQAIPPGANSPGSTTDALLTQQAFNNDQARLQDLIDHQAELMSAPIAPDLLAAPPF